MRHSPRRPSGYLVGLATAATMVLAACGGAAAPSSAPSQPAPAKPSSAAPAASAKPAATTPPASAKPAASAKPSAAASASASAAPAPTPTTLPAIAADTTKQPVTKISIPALKGKPLSADIMEIDQQAHKLYFADRTTDGVDVFDVSTPQAKYEKTITTGSGPNGVTVANNVQKVAAGLNNSHIAIIDIDPKSAKVDTVIADLDTGGKKRADEMDYDPKDKKLYVADSDDKLVTVVDMATDKIIKKFDLPALTKDGGALEQPRYNPADGMMYLTGSDDNVIYKFDPSKDVQLATFEVVDECHPNGLAIDPATDQALLGCSNKKKQHTDVWDFKSEKVVSTIDNVGAGDAAIFDPKAERYFFAASNYYRGPQMGIFSAAGKFITNVPTGNGSHMVAYDETNKIVYTADREQLLSFPLPAK